jgi:pyrroloquinoline quinone biosynthesis protein B
MRLLTNHTPSCPFIVILGIAQDGGVPHCGCQKSCCRRGWKKLSASRHATSIAIIDPKTKQRWIIDATPDFKYQLASLDCIFAVPRRPPGIEGIFLTHGHLGHYEGLLCLEKAVLSAKNIPVFAMPKMRRFLVQNRPWKDLIQKGNINLKMLQANQEVVLNRRISILPFLVPHRGEYTETIGFFINGQHKTVLFIPDIDKWEHLDEKIEDKINRADFAFLDGTFFDRYELPGRDISKVPHPFIKTSIKRFRNLPLEERGKIRFIHLNHTNPSLKMNSKARKQIEKNNLQVAEEGERFIL